MKNLIFIFVIACIQISFTSANFSTLNEDDNFIVEGIELKWQKVYASKMTIEELYQALSDKIICENITIQGNIIVADIRKFEPKIKEAGYKKMSSTPWVVNANLSGKVKIDYKEGKYRVTVYELITESQIKGKENPESVSFLAVKQMGKKKGAYRKNFLHSAKGIIQYNLSTMFSLKKSANDAW